MTTPRTGAALIHSMHATEGAGFEVRRPFPTSQLSMVDPFLLLDHMGPQDWAPGEAQGAPDHPHRGFETVSYILQGAFEHKDSAGNAGRIGPGAVQWMTAGAGVVHSEMPAKEIQTDGGIMEGFQIWVNLPAAEKMKPPQYQEILASNIPEVTVDDGRTLVRVIAGVFDGKEPAVSTHTPIAYWHVLLGTDGSFSGDLPHDWNAMVYVIHGAVTAGGVDAEESDLVMLAPDGESVEIVARGSEPADVLVLAGLPIREQVARYGPLVRTPREEIIEAFEDYQSGKMGQIAF